MTDVPPPAPGADRYHRQSLLPPFTGEGQDRLRHGRVLVAGCGALGSIVAEMLVRAGVGTVRIVDRDVVEWTNLQRQVLYDEPDARAGLPKAEAARRHLERINGDVTIEAIVDDLNANTASTLVGDGVDVIVDGLDNFETRYLLNDLAVRHAIPYVYGGAVATQGLVATFLPHDPDGRAERLPHAATGWTDAQATPCLRCVFPSPPPAGSSPTCDTVGVLGPLVTLVGSLEATEALKCLLGEYDAINRSLLSVDPWHVDLRRLDVADAWEPGRCPCCGQRRFDALSGTTTSATTALCGRDAVQITPAPSADGTPSPPLDLAALADRLAAAGSTVTRTPFMLRASIPGEPDREITLFPNGRALIKGTDRPDQARSLYARWIGG